MTNLSFKRRTRRSTMSRGAFWIGAVGCYGLAYGAILLIAAVKGRDLATGYSLLVWLVSALVLSGFCLVAALTIATILGRFRPKLGTTLFLWAVTTLSASVALLLTAA